MIVLLDDKSYVTSYATVGSIDGGIEVNEPKDLAHFEANYPAYFLNKSGELEYDGKAGDTYQEELVKDDLRIQRYRECFTYINRGQLWYDTLTKDQLEELRKWYNDWLNVTENPTRKSLPKKPEWLK